MAKIHLLDNETINKIAAGEVIESPKSIVKELVENSIDAGADEVTVEIKNGGKSFIRITDNGKGIEKDQVEDAFKRHCTSKISSSDDLNSLYTLGFRGEALASIASVAYVEMITRTADDNYGTKLSLIGGEVSLKEDIGCPVGTIITITNLFFNVPARRKFLKSDAAESSNINEIVVSLALSKENISFKYINNGSVVFRTPKTNNFLNAISSLYEKDLYNSLLKVDYENNGITITGYTTNLNYYRGNRKQQIVFLNSRLIKHKRMNYFIEAAYNTMLPKNKYPACFLKIEMDPSLVDVNVHPAKTEVRFQNEDNILNEIKRAIYLALNSNNIIKEIKKETIVHDYKDNKTEKDSLNSFTIYEKSDNKNNIKNNFDYNNEDYSNIKITEINNKSETNVNIFEETIEKSIDESLIETIEINKEIKKEPIQETFIEVKEDKANKLPELSVTGILMDTYIICENLDKTEMYMIDQHAAHERINYEKFLNQYNNKEILLQEMIVPEVINLSYDDFQTVVNYEEIFNDLGFYIENFGINAILINSIPSIFRDSNIKDIFFTILDSLKNTNKISINLELEKIIKNACVKSVKAGDKLHLIEVKALINDLGKTDNPYTCPHGRPVIIKMTKYEIEKMFERIQN